MKKIFFFLALMALPLVAVENFSANVKRVNDKVYIDKIPHISQKRNFCAPAATSMVLRYYDEKIPQKKLAKLFDSSKKNGTSTGMIVAAFENNQIPGFAIRYVYRLSKPEFDRLFDAYGAVVSKSKMRKFAQSGMRALEVADPHIAVPLFARNRKELRELMLTLLKENIGNGIPMLWSVEMNLDPKDRTPGGHMRIITGYAVNKQKEIDRVIYRDPWGSSSDNKMMTLDNAVAMTYEILIVSPTGNER